MKIFKRNINLGRKVPVIDTPDLRDECVTTDKLADGSVTTNKIADGAITREKIADKAITNLDNVVQEAQDTADHPTLVGEDNYVYFWNKQTHSYNKTSIYVRGEGFHVSKTFDSVADMEAYTGTDLKEGDFVLIQSTPDDPDNAKLYTYSGTQGIYNYLVNMSGALGFTGKTPQFSIGSIITIEPTEQASASLSPDGTDSDGNPKYKLNLALPKGEKGTSDFVIVDDHSGAGDDPNKIYIPSANAEKENATAIANEVARATETEQANATAIADEVSRAKAVEQENATAIANEVTRAKAAEQANATAIGGIEGKIPTQATVQNKLADKDFVNSSISTATANFKGTYNNIADLQAVVGADTNDYGFIVTTDAAGNTVYKKYKYVTGTGWAFEYVLNNSSFTAEQWATIQSGMTSALTSKLADLPTNTALQDALTTIRGSVTTEETRAKAAEQVNATAIANEVARATSAEQTNATAIAAEEARARAAEADRYTKSETYTKTEVNDLVDTPHQEYVTVDAYSNLPATGSKDTIYRVSNYNGSTSQVDVTSYSEYAWNGSSYTFLCVKSQIGEVFDISVYNNNTKYADLAAALNGGANIPQSLQKGGMSVKFIQSSDNKYVQYRLMSNEWTTDTNDWVIADEGVYVENPEFIYVKTDSEAKILWAIKTDGSIYYGAGVPQQVVNYINERIGEFSPDEFEDIVAFLDNLEEGDKTLQTLLNEKVDKEEGKSLIDADCASSQSAIDDIGYLQVTTDSENKILEDITTKGRKEIKIPIDTPSVSIESEDNPEYISVETDNEGKILSGRKTDGTKVEYNPQVFSEASGNTLNLDNLNLSKEGLEQLSVNLGIQGIHEYPCVRDAAKDNQIGLIKVGSELYASVVSTPSELTHKQAALPYFYYDANSTLNQYKTIGSRIAIPENICNKAEQEEIDFMPSETGKTRIIVGKSSDDVFFVSKVNCDYGDGVPDTQSKENCLETTTDFVTFTPLFKAQNSQTIVGGLSIIGYDAISIYSVKEFANGDFIVAGNCWHVDGLKTCFFLLKKDFSAITPITCTYLDGTTGLMMDEFGNNIYDWHIAISGSKALVTTYGNRQPATDYGRVWYTEDNGVTWKQIFQMTNHYQDGIDPDEPAITYTHVHGVMIDEYDNKLYVIAGEANRNLFWSDKGWDTTDNDWNVISIKHDLPLQQQTYMQVVNGYAFATNLIFGSDCAGAGAIYRLNKLGKDSYSEIQVAHEFLPNKFNSTMYCGAGMYRRDNHTPLFFCETRENCMLTEELNEILEESHKARVVATYDGINFTEIWTDDTFGTHETYISNEGITTRKFSYCGRDMNFYLLKNGDAVIKYIGRKYNYFGGNPMYSVQGNTKGCCKVRWIKNVEQYL